MTSIEREGVGRTRGYKNGRLRHCIRDLWRRWREGKKARDEKGRGIVLEGGEAVYFERKERAVEGEGGGRSTRRGLRS